MRSYWRPTLLIAFTIGLLLVSYFDVSAQCSMCRASLTAANNGKFLQSFNIAVLVLLFPPVAIFCSIFVVLRKHSGSKEDPSGQ
jgi:hypothetical protein